MNNVPPPTRSGLILLDTGCKKSEVEEVKRGFA